MWPKLVYGFRFGLAVLTLTLASAAHAAGPYYVKYNAAGSNNGTSWANAFTNLQSALAVVQEDEEIWVAAGTYKPTSGTDRTKTFVLTAGAALYGGFAGTETARAQRNWTTHPTILSGELGAAGNTDNVYHVVTGAYRATIDGFTITGGNAGSNNDGGGMLNNNVTSVTVTNCAFSLNAARNGGAMYNTSASPTLTNCTFTSNTSNAGGGAINNTNGSPKVINCTFNVNAAGEFGGGMYSNGRSPTVTNCIFSGNRGLSGGGGMYNTSSSPTVTNCTFRDNWGGGPGGGLYNAIGSSVVTNCSFIGNDANTGGGMFNGSSPTVTNCVFTSNTANSGAGMYNSGSAATIINCTFNANTANNSGGGMFNTSSSPAVINCLIWGNTATQGAEAFRSGIAPAFFNCDIKGSGGSGALWDTALGTDGGGNIKGDPLYANAANPLGPDATWRTADDGLRLLAGSPCINKGDPVDAPPTDILGNPRSGLPDIGAYERQGVSVVIAPIGNALIPDTQAYTGPTPVLIEGVPPVTWSLIQKPTGMTINSSTGVVAWPAPTMTGSPFTVTIRATNALDQDDVSWTLTVYHPGPPSKPAGGLEITYHVKTPSTSPDGQPVTYTYAWTSDQGDSVTHGPTAATSDTLTEMNLVQDGETWTVTVTPRSGATTGAPAVAKVKFVDIHNSVWVWSLYR